MFCHCGPLATTSHTKPPTSGVGLTLLLANRHLRSFGVKGAGKALQGGIGYTCSLDGCWQFGGHWGGGGEGVRQTPEGGGLTFLLCVFVTKAQR